MYITDNDYRIIIGETALKVISQAEEIIRRHAESSALEEVAGYLRPMFDPSAEFALEAEARNERLVTVVCDVALYHLSASLPQRLGSEVRKERYERAIKWLEDVQKGRIVPLLPRPTDDMQEQAEGGVSTEFSTNNGVMAYGGGKRQSNMW